MNFSRRLALKVSLASGIVVALLPWLYLKKGKTVQGGSVCSSHGNDQNFRHQGIGPGGVSKVFLVRNGSPEANVEKTLEMMGGIERFIKKDAIVVLKPNAQRFNQGMTNTDAMKGFIDLVLAIPGFSGEILVAENHQYQKDECCGWVTEERNGQFNLNELVTHYQESGYPNVTKYHWHVAGSCTYPLEGDGQGNMRVNGPEDGDGYVWMEDCFYVSPAGRKCLMTYPIFTSSYSGICIDLKNGAWQDGHYIDRPISFINFSALNHHGRYAGVSASVKNLMGVVDMTCGFPGDFPQETYNTHHVGVSRLKHWLFHGHWRLRKYRGPLRHRFEDWCYRNFHHTGGVLGYFMAHVRSPDLNIITADLVGWGDRKRLDKAFRPKAILASTDPVAMDYVAAREILLPGTPIDATEVSGVHYAVLNNPDAPGSVFRKFLAEAEKYGVGTLDLSKIEVVKHEFL